MARGSIYKMGRLGGLLERYHGNRKRDRDVGGNGVGIDTMHDLDATKEFQEVEQKTKDRGGKIGRLDRLDQEN